MFKMWNAYWLVNLVSYLPTYILNRFKLKKREFCKRIELFNYLLAYLSSIWTLHYDYFMHWFPNGFLIKCHKYRSRQRKKGQPSQTATTTDMQKSKSSSHVGQVFSKKIWNSRSKSQTRPAVPPKSQWVPQVSRIII